MTLLRKGPADEVQHEEHMVAAVGSPDVQAEMRPWPCNHDPNLSAGKQSFAGHLPVRVLHIL